MGVEIWCSVCWVRILSDTGQAFVMLRRKALERKNVKSERVHR